MSDDLVKRLRNTPNWKREEYGDYKSTATQYDRAPFEAADRIEELEAKLGRAVEALQVVEQATATGDGLEPALCGQINQICAATLAERKGQDDE